MTRGTGVTQQGRVLYVNPDPPSYQAPAPLETKIRFEFPLSPGVFNKLTDGQLRAAIKAHYQLADESLTSIGLVSIRAWLKSNTDDDDRQLTMAVYDPFNGGTLRQIADNGANTRYAAVGYSYPARVQSICLANTSTSLLLADFFMSEASARKVLVEFTVRLVFYSNTVTPRLAITQTPG